MENDERFIAIEAYIQKAKKSSGTILKQFSETLKDDLACAKKDEQFWGKIQNVRIDRRSERFEEICKQMQEENEALKKRIETIDGEIDNMSIQAIVERDKINSEYNEKHRTIRLNNLDEETTLKNESEETIKKCADEEQKLREHIEDELNKKKTVLYKMKSNFKTQIIDKNNQLQQAKTECQHLRRQRDELRRKFNEMDSIPIRNMIDQESLVVKTDETASYVTSSDYEEFEKSFRMTKMDSFVSDVGAAKNHTIDEAEEIEMFNDSVEVQTSAPRIPPKVYDAKNRKSIKFNRN